jgi:hypothetical protein
MTEYLIAFNDESGHRLGVVTYRRSLGRCGHPRHPADRQGHTPDQAQQWAESVPAWREASETSRTAGAVAVLGIWEYMRRDDPAPHRRQLTDAARTWAQHRLAAALTR